MAGHAFDLLRARLGPRAVRWLLPALVVVIFDAVLVARAEGGAVPVDFEVYRLGAGALLHGGFPYAVHEPSSGLGFTYPVFAALLLGPLALVSSPVAFIAVLAGNTALYWLIWRLLREWLVPPPESWPVLVSLGWLCEPITSTLALGQVNLLVTGLVLVDMTVWRGARWQGVGIGVAAGFKITPAVFVLVLLWRRQWRECGIAVGTFAATVLVGAIWAPAASWWYWTTGLWRINRVGMQSALNNQSLPGLLARLVGVPQLSAAAFTGTVVVALVLVVPLLRRLSGTVSEPTFVAVIGVVALLVAPISWSHHWIWLPLLGLCLWRPDRPYGMAVAAAFVLAVDARWFVTYLGRPSWGHSWEVALLANSFPMLAVGLLVVAARRSRLEPAVAGQGAPARGGTGG